MPRTPLRRLPAVAVTLLLGAACATSQKGGARPASSPAADSAAGRVYDIAVVETRPSLQNSSVVAQALERAYPAELRNAAMGGTVEVSMLVEPNGRVSSPRVVRSSGQPPLDMAAITVARSMHFTPALVDGKPVRVLVFVPIAFTPR